MSHRHRLVTLLVAVLVVACASPDATSPAPSAPPTGTPAPTPSAASANPTAAVSPTPVPSDPLTSPVADLTGLSASPELGHRLPLAVMIDDARAARPQSGFNAASLVYHSLADGYESRYLLIFQEGDAAEVGPVRSARFYLVQWASEVRAAVAHYGGDRRTRDYIKAVRDAFTSVDGLGAGKPAYRRVRSRKAPHNAYTMTERLREVALDLGAPTMLDAALHRRPFVDPAEAHEAADGGGRIRIPFPTNVITYRYHAASGRYRRSVDGKAHVDAGDGKRVTATNVVVLFQKFRIDTKIEPGHSRPDYRTLGSGDALVFQEGRLIEATWEKADDGAPTRLLDADGAEIPLVRGRTFFEVVPPGTKVTHGDR